MNPLGWPSRRLSWVSSSGCSSKGAEILTVNGAGSPMPAESLAQCFYYTPTQKKKKKKLR